MSLDSKVSALTARLRSEFFKSFDDVAVPAEWKDYASIIPSSTRIENQVIRSPVPGLQEWLGHRSYATIDSFIYQLQNKTFHSGFEATLEDIDDDQVGLLLDAPKQLVVKAKIWPGRKVLQTLAAGASTKCFDGTNFFASSHSFGTGNNTLTYTTYDSTTGSSTANNTYKLASLYYGDSLKPMLWQERQGPKFGTTAGSVLAQEARIVKWWADLRGTAGFGWWWHSVLTTISGLPSITEMHDIFRNIRTRYKSFLLPKTSTSEDGEYIHEQTKLTSNNHQLVGSPDLEEVLDQAVNQDWVPQAGVNVSSTTAATVVPVATKNNFAGFARVLVSNYF